MNEAVVNKVLGMISLCRRVYQVSGGRMELLDNDRAQRLAMDF